MQPNDYWKKAPETIQGYYQMLPRNTQLCQEVEYILKSALKTEGIEYSAVTSRPKTLNSFLDKLSRKNYSDPFVEVTDFSGIRVVVLYSKDISDIEEVINNNFVILEKVDKLADQNPDQFGYGATHFIVKLGKKMSGARYDDLKDLVCEIQVRTVLQDAWAIIDHHLVYKSESAIPKSIQRKLNSLSGLFETADDQFERIRAERESYNITVSKSQRTKKSFLSNESNYDTIKQYLEWKYSGIPFQSFDDQLSLVVSDIPLENFPVLKDLDDLINTHIDKIHELFAKLGDAFKKADGEIPASMYLATALGFDNLEYAINIGPDVYEYLESYFSTV